MSKRDRRFLMISSSGEAFQFLTTLAQYNRTRHKYATPNQVRYRRYLRQLPLLEFALCL